MNKRKIIKKILIITAVVVVVLTCALALIFCSGDEHIPGRVVKDSVSDATCANRGSYYKITYCLKCNEELSKTLEYTNRDRKSVV